MDSRPDVKRYHGLVRLAHWLNAVVLLGMIASGLQIYNGVPPLRPARRLPYPNPLDGTALPDWARLGGWLAGGLNWHFAAGLAVRDHRPGVPRLSGDVRRVALPALPAARPGPGHPDAALLPAAPQGATRRRASTTRSRRRAYTFIVVLGAVSALSGFAIYKPVQLAWLTTLFGGYELARYWHFCGGLDLRRLHPAPRRAGVPGGSGLAPGHDHRLVSREVSQP